ncbi:MAG: right-handed parallel beta-helix repeat-containing protein [Acidobacteriota bacterium]
MSFAAFRRLALAALVTFGAVAVSPLAALETFTLPTPAAGAGLYLPDVQASYPDVDWQTLDRLYLPAAHYKFLRLGGLPQRSPQRPLVITNLGGQVRVGGLGHYYNFVISGGSNWRLTGRDDAEAATGDAAFPGHDGGYANSRGSYGILIDDAFESEGESGLGIGGGATAFTVEFVEVRHVGFAGFLIKTDDEGNAHMDDVVLRDNYIHDVGSEGIYLGSTQSQPQHAFRRLHVVNNRVLRTGTEALQVGQLADGSVIENNVFLMGATDWKHPFQPFQDNAAQQSNRSGDVALRRNLVIGGASKFFIFFGFDVAGDAHSAADTYAIERNYFSHSRSFGVYVHAAADGVTTFRFADNVFREIDFTYDELDAGATNYDTVLRVANVANPIEVIDNRWHGPSRLVQAFGSNVVESGNVEEQTPAVRFVDSGFPDDFDVRRFETWTDVDIDGDPVAYEIGDWVRHGVDFYRALAAHTNRLPPDHPGTWEPMPPPTDDVRLAMSSPHQGLGLLDNPANAALFAEGFESGDLQGWDAAVP